MKLYLIIAALALFASCNSAGKKDEASKGDTTIVTKPVDIKVDLESFGEIKIGQHYKQTLSILGNPELKSPPIEWEADGLMHEDWNFRSKGLAINMTSEIGKEDSTRSIFSITATDPCAYKTKANIGIGNTYDEVQTAYKGHINTEMTTPEQIIVGEIYGGIFFTFGSDKKVNRVFLGSAAE